MRPVGTAEMPALYAAGFISCAHGTRVICSVFPPLKWRAIFGGPFGTLAPRNEFVSRYSVAQRTLGGFGNADTWRHLDPTRPEAVVHDKEV
jgi:hypothetical protein